MLRIAAHVVLDDFPFPDWLVWRATQDGNFPVASAYNMATGHLDEQNIDAAIFKKIWKLRVQERIRFFMWTMVKGGIFTNEERKRHYMTQVDYCGKMYRDL